MACNSPVLMVRRDWVLESWEFSSGKVDRTVRLDHMRAPASRMAPLALVAFTVDGTILAACEPLCSGFATWDVYSGQRILEFWGHKLPVTALHFSPDSQQVASGDEGGCLQLWNAHTGESLMILTGHLKVVTSLAWVQAPFSSSSLLASASLDATVRLWDPELGGSIPSLDVAEATSTSQAAVESWQLSPAATTCLDVDTTATRLAIGTKGGKVAIVKLPHGGTLGLLASYQSPVNQVVFSPCDDLLGTCCIDENCITLLDAKDKHLTPFRRFTVVSLQSFTWLSSISIGSLQSFPSSTARLWSIETGKEEGKREVHDTELAALRAYSS
mmetsp:Transcript_31268/g.66377  ORF Transcript_31268/g.66377 Transcript_31268/m.66377 type:complete len:329 (+) Transcript_31268:191-1177(+)|eukprot:CAMPEP_0206526894 /NCGR_PEP_ID=MMETSP0325_2-20121206/1014_1 /ASSEMBLY_ACC=CAM_ASM_000347 /TAXON_ID=2866 /ORGANISM="Crypthecodinium cohnii, Strain Seligo" /LENGTH=328 /DNA_ID=CAMNT_0054022179 /DNA_START=89 /DNA_END=1075 /DNA_ORIENTATION=-